MLIIFKTLIYTPFRIMGGVIRHCRNILAQAKFKSENPTLVCNYPYIFTNRVINHGESNSISVGNNSSITNCSIKFFGSRHRLSIADNVNLHDISIRFEDDNGLIIIGNNTTIEHGCHLSSLEGTKIQIGSDCMLSNDIDIRTSDSHSILNEDGLRINPANDITIGNHVWIGVRSTILKGATIVDNCIIAACSLVTSKTNTDPNIILAGQPAKMVKKGINWHRERF